MDKVELQRLQLDELVGMRVLAAIMYAAGLAAMIERFPLGYVNAHRWYYSPYLESQKPPCIKYETRTIMVYNPQLKTTLPQTTRVCVERAVE